MDSISYMRNLSLSMKHEIMYKMKRMHFEKDGMLFKIDEIATKMFIIQSGVVEIMQHVENEDFSIEKLYRESIILHNAFLLADDNDAYAKCTSTVSVFALDINDLT